MITIPVHAFVSQAEQAAIRAAAQDLAQTFGVLTGSAVACDPIFVADLEALAQSPPGAIRLLSLVPELSRLDEPWTEVEARLLAACEALGAGGDPVFICTILRHAGSDDDADLLYSRRVRIRRLNFLAAELSRQTGAFVVDVDRVIADIGGRNLQADYRLDSPAAATVAGHAVALCIVANGLDAFVPFELQDKAREIIVQNTPRPSLGQDLVPANVMALGRGRRKQTVATVTDTESDNQVGRLLRQTLKRELAPAEAFDKLVQAVRRRGVVESGTLVASAVLRMVKGHRR
jgi:hypothetical protein